MFKKKKLMALALACVMATSLAAPTFAATPPPQVDGNSITLPGKFEPPTVSVVIGPNTGNKVYINPYGAPIVIQDENIDGNYYELNGQIVTTPLYIANMGITKLNIGAQVTVSNLKGFELSDREISTKETEKKANLILEVATFAAGAAASGGSSNSASVKAMVGNMDADTLGDHALHVSADPDNWTGAQQLVLGEEPVSSDDMGTLAGNAAQPLDTSDIAYIDFAEGAIGVFRITGTCTTFPEGEWTTNDGFDVKIVFSFTVTA